jgi:hypothetical protein
MAIRNYEIDLSFLSPYRGPIWVLAAALLGFLGVLYILMPMRADSLAARDGAINQMQDAKDRLDNAEGERADLESRAADFDGLVARGLFDGQDRLAAAAELEKLRRDTGLYSVHYEFGVRQESPFPSAGNDFTLFETEIRLDMTSAEDISIRRFLSGMEREMPGRVALRDLAIRRSRTADSAALAQLAAGGDVELVRATATLTWWTLDRAALGERAEASGGGAPVDAPQEPEPPREEEP